MEELEARMARMEEEFRRRSSLETAAIASCVTSVRRKDSGSWQLLRADGSEAGLVEAAAAAVAVQAADAAAAHRRRHLEEAAQQCVVEVSLVEGGGSLKIRRLDGSVALVALGGKEPLPPPEQRPTGVAERMASELLRAPAHALLPTFGGASSSSPPPAIADEDRQHRGPGFAEVLRRPSAGRGRTGTSSEVAYPELTCRDAVHREWLEVKAMLSEELDRWRVGPTGNLLGPSDGESGRARLQAAMDAAVQKVSKYSHVDECGMGRLCMSLLAIAAGASSSLLAAQAIHSPLLTVLLDVPWQLVLASGWPLFALLERLQPQPPPAHLDPGEAASPTSQAASAYFAALTSALDRREASRIATLGADFLRSPQGREHASDHVLPGLCALASQLLSPEVGTASMPVEVAVRQVQGFFRQAVQSMEDVQGTLESAWPLYRVLHLATLTLQLG